MPVLSVLSAMSKSTIGIGVGIAAGLTGAWWLYVALVVGALGLRSAGRRIASDRALWNLRREPWYAIGGGVIGLGIARTFLAIGGSVG